MDTADRSLKKLVLRGSAVELIGYGLAQVLRFVSNLVLSRLLFPEAFGLSALVGVVMQGLIMLTDMGIEQSVIQNARGDEPRFLNTAWTMHVVRSSGLWAISCLLAWPAAYLYGEPELLLLLPVASFGIVIQGFASTSVFTLRRRVALGVLNALELGTQTLGMILTIVFAYLWRSVWALVIGGMIAGAVRTLVTHLLRVGERNRFAWDPTARSEIFHFGKYIFGSSAFSFVGMQADRLLLGRLMGLHALGIYSIALNLSDVIVAVITRITYGVLYPAFSKVGREGTERMKGAYYKARLMLDLLGLAPLGMLFSCSDWVVHFLYDERYAGAGGMLKLLCVRAALNAMLIPCETCLFALGQTKYGMYRNIARAVFVVPAMVVGYSALGLTGILWAIVLAEIPVAVVLWRPFVQAGLFSIWGELRGAILFVAGVLVGMGVLHLVLRWIPPLTRIVAASG